MPETVQLQCSICKSPFLRSTANHKRYLRRNHKSVRCNSCCAGFPPVVRRCHHCSNETANPKYCSRACAASANNQRPRTRLQPTGRCADCGGPIRISRKYCKNCLLANHRINAPNKTLNDLFRSGSRNVYHTSVRQHAKQIAAAAGLLAACSICGYSTYVECCHIKAVSTFPKTTLLSVVNAKENLIGLCPNHHQELDMGLLKLVRGERFELPTSCL